jgi:hypothetical protein
MPGQGEPPLFPLPPFFRFLWPGRVLPALAGYDRVVKGDWVEVVVDTGGDVRNYEVRATRAGRRVESVVRRGLVEVSELTRGGTVIRTARFMASRVIAVVEHPAPRRPGEDPSGRDG